jgi:glyoxylate reductase
MDVLYTKRTRLEPLEAAARGITWASFDELLKKSDYVVMLADYNESTHQMMGAREFSLMKPSAYFINTGRGRLVDEDALIAALQNGTIAGSGLDVFYHEPPVIRDPWVPPAFSKMDNVVLAPHNGGATRDAWKKGSLMLSAQSIVAAIEQASIAAVNQQGPAGL